LTENELLRNGFTKNGTVKKSRVTINVWEDRTDWNALDYCVRYMKYLLSKAITLKARNLRSWGYKISIVTKYGITSIWSVAYMVWMEPQLCVCKIYTVWHYANSIMHTYANYSWPNRTMQHCNFNVYFNVNFKWHNVGSYLARMSGRSKRWSLLRCVVRHYHGDSTRDFTRRLASACSLHVQMETWLD
jgi:hypothetical protein